MDPPAIVQYVSSPYFQESNQQIQPIISQTVEKWESLSPWRCDRQPLIFIGGFQGAGKSILLDQLNREFGLAIISADVVRYALMQKGVPVGEELQSLVDATNRELIRKGIEKGLPVALDVNAHKDRLEKMKDLVCPNHQVVKILLKADPDTLRLRVSSRIGRDNAYNGTVDDLNASLALKTLDEGDYDIVFQVKDFSDATSLYEKVSSFFCERFGVEKKEV